MSTPHSLNLSSNAQQPTNSNTKRNSLGSNQLPLPNSLNAPPTPRQPPALPLTIPPLPTGPPPPPRATPGRLSVDHHQQPNSPISGSFPISLAPPLHASSTHAGGIQPSASFFRPSRPIYQPQYSPSSTSSIPAQAPEPDAYQLAPISNRDGSLEDHHPAESVGGGPESMVEDSQGFIALKRIKQSREPLLPLGGRVPQVSRPSLARDRGGSHSNIPSSKSAGRLMRNSLDRVFSISRGISFDSIRKSASIRGGPEGRPTFESKLSDEEHAYSPTSAYIKNSMHHHQSLDVRTFRNSAGLSAPSPSPEPSFVPTPPDHKPPLSAVPVINPRTGKVLRRYKLHPSRNRFFFNGRLLTGGDSPWAFVASFGLLCTIAGVWFGTTAVWWWHNESPAVAAVGAYLALLTISTMLATATIDPGILPRNLDPDPPYPSTSPSDGGVRVPMPRDLKVRSDVVRVKYCPTCKTYRPPRSSHCKMCDNCIDGCDHHCQWVNNCVGRRNYPTFFALLVAATTTLILIIVTSALHLFLLTKRDHINFKAALNKGAGSAVAFCLSIAVIWPVAALLSYHMRLLLLNITTIEQIRNQAHKTLVPGPPPPNPFSHGNWRRNLLAVLCRPQGYSWLNGAGIVMEDKREVNPGQEGGAGEWEGDRPPEAVRMRQSGD